MRPGGRYTLACCAQRGGVAEWLNATVLKTVDPQGFVGSNPTPSARTLGASEVRKEEAPARRPVLLRLYYS